MRTTLDIEDHLLDRLRKIARRAKLPLKEVVRRALGAGLDMLEPRPRRKPYRLTTYRMGFPPSLSLDKALHIAAVLEDDETVRKLLVGK
jgi:hypothetical protein